MYASTIPVHEVITEVIPNSFEHNWPQVKLDAILARHYEESIGSQYPAPDWFIEKQGEHGWQVRFYYPVDENQCQEIRSFNGKHWE